MQIQHLAIDSLHPHPRNAHTHSAKQIDAIAESIRRFGFLVPIVADENRTILAGHGRWQSVGWTRVLSLVEGGVYGKAP